MKGFVPTPPHLVDAMVAKLFAGRAPRAGDALLDPGCGTGAFIEGVLRWCDRHGCPVPKITGIDSDPRLLAEARQRLGAAQNVDLLERDFLLARPESFDYIVGNPPYVPITGLSVEERAAYRRQFRTAVGRFDLYLLFFEQALKQLKPSGRLVFITPEKFLYVETADPLRQTLVEMGVEEIELVDESAFGELITYPTITIVSPGCRSTRVKLRDGTSRTVRLRANGSWLPSINRIHPGGSAHTLADACIRISCGVATGADAVYVVKDADLPKTLREFAFRTVSGRRLTRGTHLTSAHSLLVPYDRVGVLLPEDELGPLGEYLREPTLYARLMQRTCVARKPWYAFHENPPLPDLLRPKILCKDIGARPWFAVDDRGDIVPRHSVYYVVPAEPEKIHELCAYLNSAQTQEWLMAHCQRAANGFVRLQSHVLKRVPVPERFTSSGQLAVV